MQQLAEQVRDRLIELNLETPVIQPMSPDAQERIEHHYREIMVHLGLDLNDDSLQNTPKRVAKMYTQEVFYGLNYENFPVMNDFEDKMNTDEMVAVKCTVKSMCEHHACPFIGVAHIAYIPSTRVLGLSKFNRLTDFFSRRPQVQERLTKQIQKALEVVLQTADVAVVVKAAHYCVHLRGVQDMASETVTSAMGGKFFSNSSLRAEFLSLTR